MKKLAQALKKCVKYEAEQRNHASPLDHSRKVLAQTLKRTVKAPHPNMSMKMLVNALKQNVERRTEQSTRTYAERIRKLIGPPEQCKECGGEHPTRLCMK